MLGDSYICVALPSALSVPLIANLSNYSLQLWSQLSILLCSLCG